jgi:hypothetical protein
MVAARYVKEEPPPKPPVKEKEPKERRRRASPEADQPTLFDEAAPEASSDPSPDLSSSMLCKVPPVL